MTNSNNIYVGGNLVKAIKLGFLIHDLVIFSRKTNKYSLKVRSKVLAQ